MSRNKSKFCFINSLFLLVSITGGCEVKSTTNNEAFTGVSLIVSYPIIYSTDTGLLLSKFIDTIHIFYYDKNILYQLPAVRNFETNEKIPNTEPYFLFKSGEQYGFLYSSLTEGSKESRLLVDSFLNKRAFRSASFSSNLIDSLIEINEHKITGEIVEKFIPNAHSPEDAFDSTFHYFSKQAKELPYSFYGNLDSNRNEKLWKVRLLYSAKYSEIYKKTLPKREYYFEIRKLELMQKSQKLYKDFIRLKSR